MTQTDTDQMDADFKAFTDGLRRTAGENPFA